ncbi:type III secretion system stator protein SctL [Stutzerimonas urumqiensis]|uniref:type III secretion system stator protein SctL n=1 Tax=Stutzerimonas urumqiensis TaxID=638269 RepID=UPI003BAC1231
MNALPTRPAGRLLRAAEARAWQDGFGFIEAAREQAAQVREGAMAEADMARRQGYAEGRAQGADAAAELLARTQADVDRYLAGLEDQLAQLALGIVRQVIDGLDDAERIAALAARALADFRDERALSLRVAPERVAAVQRRLAERLGDAAPDVIGDAHLHGGQATLVGAMTEVELDAEAQLEAIARALMTDRTQVPA